MKKNLGYMLLESNLIDEIQMKIALEDQKRTGKRFGSTLVDLKFIDENVLAAFLSKQMDIPCINIMHVDVSPRAKDLVPYKVAKECEAVPIKIDQGRLYVAMVDPTDINLISKLEEAAERPVTPFIAPQSSIDTKLQQVYFTSHETLDEDNPMFTDIINEVEGLSHFQERLSSIEDELKDIRKLLKKVLARLSGDKL
ncbi:MAG TPA: hypothetical protein PK014_10320 [Thermoanaerobaculia bacterium]|nr:hypothetical protein [Thermoanaerobaculia bacterium]HUM30514.1 hypothetical protein [Thermoanaerobaculia bacterium]HXK68706.1 hypothetical protein [Thermoanaerobaculia bacterium]